MGIFFGGAKLLLRIIITFVTINYSEEWIPTSET